MAQNRNLSFHSTLIMTCHRVLTATWYLIHPWKMAMARLDGTPSKEPSQGFLFIHTGRGKLMRVINSSYIRSP